MMQHRKSIEAGAAEGSISALARSDLLHHVDAISRALKNWNDTESLKLLRLHWQEIACAIRQPAFPGLIPVLRDAGAGVDRAAARFDEVIDRSANDDIRLSAAPLRTAP